MLKHLPFSLLSFFFCLFSFFHQTAFTQTPVISVTPSSFTENLFTGGSTSQTMTISNSGDGDLNYLISTNYLENLENVNYALQFDGINDEILVNDSQSLHITDKITIEVWVNLLADGSSTMLRKDGNFLLEVGDAGNNCPAFLLWWSDGDATRIDGPEIPKNEWHHWVGTYNGKRMSLFIDGQEVNYINIVKTIAVTNTELWIGMFGSEWFKGILDEIRIWNTARTQTEIRTNMYRELTGSEPGLVGYWKFNEGNGTIAYDLTINQNHGQLNGGVTWMPSSAPISPVWLSANPDTGVVPSASSVNVNVIFNSEGLEGGSYQANLDISSNDLSQPTITLPVQLQVTSAPDLMVSNDSLRYGSVFIRTPVTKNFVVYNKGFETLVVSDIISNDPVYTVQPTNFVLSPAESQEISVTFTPVSAIIYPRILAIHSNDHYEPVKLITLLGEGIIPPVISVTPTSFSKSLPSGKSTSDYLTISNSGGSDLNFEISFESLGATFLMNDIMPESSTKFHSIIASSRQVSLEKLKESILPFPGNLEVKTTGPVDESANIVLNYSPTPSDLTLIEAGQGFEGEEVFGSRQNAYSSGPRTRGNIFACTHSTTLIEHRLYLAPSSTAPLWFLVYEGTEQIGNYDLINAAETTPPGTEEGWYSSGHISVPLTAGKYYLITASFSSVTTYWNEQGISPYPIEASFGELIGAAGWNWAPTSNFPPDLSQDVPDYAFGDPVAYYQTIVTMQSISADPQIGTIPAGANLNVLLTFEASGLAGGDYQANIIISSNDPLQSEFIIPANLNVTDAPSIHLEIDTLNFGEVFLGDSVSQEILVTNNGTMDLLISNVSIQPAEYTVSPTFAGIDPGETEIFTISFLPQTVGNYTGMLVFFSNDPELLTHSVHLSGQGVEPPVIIVSPCSLYQALRPGQTASQTVTVSNGGGSNLFYEVYSYGGMQLLVEENFNSGFPFTNFTLYNNAYYNSAEGRIYLTDIASLDESGALFYQQRLQTRIMKINFDFEIFGGWGADGLVLAVLDSAIMGGAGGGMGFYGTTASGWGIEFDTFENPGET